MNMDRANHRRCRGTEPSVFCHLFSSLSLSLPLSPSLGDLLFWQTRGPTPPIPPLVGLAAHLNPGVSRLEEVNVRTPISFRGRAVARTGPWRRPRTGLPSHRRPLPVPVPSRISPVFLKTIHSTRRKHHEKSTFGIGGVESVESVESWNRVESGSRLENVESGSRLENGVYRLR